MVRRALVAMNLAGGLLGQNERLHHRHLSILGALVPLFLGWPLSPDPSVLPSGRCNPEMGHSRREEREGDGEVGGVGGVSQPRDFGLIVPILAIASRRWLLCLRLQSPDSDSVSPWESPSSGWTGEAGLPTSE